MNLLNQEILSAIDNIDNMVQESEISVLSALCECYEKQAMILEHSTSEDVSEFSVFQEGFIMEDGESTKKNVLKSLLNGIKSIFKRFVSFLRRKCKYVGLLVQMKRNPNKEVYSPLPLGKTYEAYVEFEKWMDQVLSFIKEINPEDINTTAKSNEYFRRRYMSGSNDPIYRPSKAYHPYQVDNLRRVYEKLDRGEKLAVYDMHIMADAGDKKEYSSAKMFDNGRFYRDNTQLVTIESIVKNIEKLSSVRESIAKKVDSSLKIFEKYEGIQSDNDNINSVLGDFAWIKKEIMWFMNLDTVLERCLTHQFTEFLEYSNKHKETKG